MLWKAHVLRSFLLFLLHSWHIYPPPSLSLPSPGQSCDALAVPLLPACPGLSRGGVAASAFYREGKLRQGAIRAIRLVQAHQEAKVVLEVEFLFPELSVLSLLPVLGRCYPHTGAGCRRGWGTALSVDPPGHGKPFPGCRTPLPPLSQGKARVCASPRAFLTPPRLPRGPQEETNSISNAGNSPKGVQS